MNKRVTELLEMVDEVVMEYSYSLLESQGDLLDAKELQISLQGFLHQHAQTFVSELWNLLLDASQRADGIPLKILQEQQVEKVLQDAKPIKEEKVIPKPDKPRRTSRERERDRERSRERGERSSRRSRSRERKRSRSRSRSKSRERQRSRSRERRRSRSRERRRRSRSPRK